MIAEQARILCVDDEPDLLNINVSILRSAGYEVLEASSGNECMATARKEHPDLILLDVQLPDMNGFDVCKQIKSDPELSRSYIILISGRETSSETQAIGLDAGADGYIARPVSGKELLARIQAMLRLKRAEVALRSSEIKYKALIENISDVVFQLTPLGVIHYVSPKVEENYGYMPEDLIGKDLSVTTPDSAIPKALELLRRVLSGEEIKNFELPQLDSKGNIIVMELNCNPIRDDGKIIGMQGIMRDITDRKKTERELREALLVADAANRAKADFLANISHELTTPLNVTIGFSQILQDELYGKLNEKQMEYISDILNSGTHLLGLLNDMLDMSKLDIGNGEVKKDRFLLKDLLMTMNISFREKSLKKNIVLELDIVPEAEMEIEADLGMMKQIMFNLLDNALKYTPAGGSVRVAARRAGSADKQSIYPELRTQYSELDGNFVDISVADTGIGIRQEDVPMLFNAFTQLESPYTKKYAGTGLGLALTKKLVELHGGRIWVESEFGKGSKFTFVMPVR